MKLPWRLSALLLLVTLPATTPALGEAAGIEPLFTYRAEIEGPSSGWARLDLPSTLR